MTDILKSDLIGYMKANCRGHLKGRKRHIILNYLIGRGHSLTDETFRDYYKEIAFDKSTDILLGSAPKFGYFTIETIEDLNLTTERNNMLIQTLSAFNKNLIISFYERNLGQGVML